MSNSDTNPRITFKEVLALGVPEGTLKRRLINREWQTVVVGVAGNGKPAREILLASLPEDLQLRYADRQRPVAAEDLEVVSPETEFSEPTKSDDDGLDRLTQSLSGYEPAEREAWIAEALRLNDLVNRYVAIKVKRRSQKSEVRGQKESYTFVPAVLALCAEAVCTDETILASLSARTRRGDSNRLRSTPVSPHTLDTWARKRKQFGLLAFVRSRSTVKKANDRRLAKVSPDAIEWLEEHWRRYPIATLCYVNWEKAARNHGWKIPKLSWLQRRYKNISPVVRTAVHGSDKEYTGKYKPFLMRTRADLAALQLLCGDHHVLDVFCWSEQLKKAVRLWVTLWQDMGTGLIWGKHLDYTPSSFTIGCAYADGVRTFGAQPPSGDGFQSYIYTDNGKDYRSRNITGEIEIHQHAAAVTGGLELLLTQRGVGLAHDAGVKQMLARNYNGREKPVERAFRDLADWIQNEFFDSGWCGRSTDKKPDAYRDLYARHQKAIKRGAPSPFPAEADVRRSVAEWFERYNTIAHARADLNGAKVIPLEEYNRLYTNRYEISEETLALMVMKTIRGPLKKNGVVALGSSYWHNELSRWKGRRGPDSKPLQLEVRYIDSDYTTAWIVLPDGAICEAQRVDVSSMLGTNKESLKAVSERMRAERSLIKNATLLHQSMWRGESVEDRIAAELPAEEIEQQLPIAVGENGQGQARVHLFNRFDAKKHRAPVTRIVTSQDIAGVDADESIFGAEESRGRVQEFDFDE